MLKHGEAVRQSFTLPHNVSVFTQLDAAASNLNSNDAFVLVTPDGSFLWVGVGASDTEKQGAQQLCDILGVSASELSEGGETGELLTSDYFPILFCVFLSQTEISLYGVWSSCWNRALIRS